MEPSKKRIITFWKVLPVVALFIVAAVSLSACGSASNSVSERIQGTWKNSASTAENGQELIIGKTQLQIVSVTGSDKVPTDPFNYTIRKDDEFDTNNDITLAASTAPNQKEALKYNLSKDGKTLKLIESVPNSTTGQASDQTITFTRESDASKLLEVPKLQSKDIKEGTGAAVSTDETVTVNYTGWLYVNGKKTTEFDSSLKKGREPFSFKVGSGQVIQGWDQGLVGMKVGGKRQLIIPPNLGYGAQGQSGIPANSTLLFEVELLKIEK